MICAEGSRTQTSRVGKEADGKAGSSRDCDHRGVTADYAIAGSVTGARTRAAKETDRFPCGRTACTIQILKTIEKGETTILKRCFP